MTTTTTKQPRTQKCTLCDKPSIPGLVRGKGKCQYHWNAGVWGKEWADRVERDRNQTETGARK